MRQGDPNKVAAFEEILRLANVDENEVAFVGDDLTDIPLMQRAELAVAVADAVEEVKRSAHLVTTLEGGRGAIREVVELLLKSQGHWEDLVEHYTGR